MLDVITLLLAVALVGGAVAGVYRWATVSSEEDEVVLVIRDPGAEAQGDRYELLKQGKQLVLPGFESTTHLTTAPFEIFFEVGDVYDDDENEYVVSGEVTLQISRDPERLGRAVEEFLGSPPEAVPRTAQAAVEEQACQHLDVLAERGFDAELESRLRQQLEPELEASGLELLDIQLELAEA